MPAMGFAIGSVAFDRKLSAKSVTLTAKDLALYFIARVGVLGAPGFAVEYAGPAIAATSMAVRMTLCNMTI